ncbi:MAG: FAD-binding oxidoreductase, partial [Candidatus Hodarchaeota archaeon]
AVTQAYTKNFWFESVPKERQNRPAAIVLPASVEEVQSIIRLANRYEFPFIPVATALWTTCIPSGPGYVIIESKRMDRIIEIDEKNMYATIEPYVTYAQLHSEGIKKGLTLGIPMSSSQISVLANHLFCGITGMNHWTGYQHKNILAVEMVLPDGEILEIGSRGLPNAGNFWGEGPGPDLRGLLRGLWGHMGGMGMITKMTIKLFPWVGAKTIEAKGISPNREMELPQNMRNYLINFDKTEDAIEAMYQIGASELGTSCTRITAFWGPCIISRSANELHKLWNSGLIKSMMGKGGGLVVRLEENYKGSIDYEDKVLTQIAEETHGNIIPREIMGPFNYVSGELIRPGSTLRAQRAGGMFFAIKLTGGSLEWCKEAFERANELKKEYIPHVFLDDDGSCWCASIDHGHLAYTEIYLYGEMTEEAAKAGLELTEKSIYQDLGKRFIGAQYSEDVDLIGPHHSNYHILLRRFKKTFDSKNVSNPPNPIPWEEKEGDWYKKGD